MSPASAAQLAFAAEFATFLIATAGALTAARSTVMSRRAGIRPLIAFGYVTIAVSAFLRGAAIIDQPRSGAFATTRIAGLVLLALGTLGWRGRGSAVAQWAGIVLLTVAVAVATIADRVVLADGVAVAGAAALAVALVLVARRSIPVRIAVDAAVIVLGVVLLVAVVASITVARSVDGEAFQRYAARGDAEAEGIAATARTGLGPARIVAGVLAAERADALAASAAEGAAPNATDALHTALADLTDDHLLGLDQPVVLLNDRGAPVAASPADLSRSLQVGLAGGDLAVDGLAASSVRQGVAVVGEEAFAIAVAPVVVRPVDAPQRTVGLVIVAQRLDDSYLQVLGAGGESLAFSLATPTRVIAASSAGGDSAGRLPVVADALASGASAEARDGDRFVVASPIPGDSGGGDSAGLAFVVNAPGTAAADTRADLFRSLFVVALVAGSIAVLLAALVGTRIGRGIRTLTGAARDLQAGNELRTLTLRGDDELGVLRDSFTSMAGAIGTMTDELREVAVEEATVRARLQAVVLGMSEALIAIDADDRIIELNVAAEDLLGVGRSDAIDRPVGEIVRWRLLDGGAIDMQRDDLPDGLPMAADVAVGESSVPVVVTAGSLVASGGKDGGAVIVFRDVRSEREVEDLKASILANIGHELRTPLTPIKGYAGMLRDRPLTQDRVSAFAGEIIDGVEQLERVVAQLVTFATINAGRLRLDRTQHRTVDIADAAAARWRERVPDTHRLWVDSEAAPATVDVDLELFAQALDEVIDNAVKYSPEGGDVIIRFATTRDVDIERATPGPVLIVDVLDDGVGLPGGLDEVADPFVQVDASSTRRFGGLGLGLACADRIVRAHGGRLAHRPNKQRGSIVSILVPGDTSTGAAG